MHAAMGFAYEQPAWELLDGALVERDGMPTMAAFLRRTAEAYLLHDPRSGRKRDKSGDLYILHRELRAQSRLAGLEDWHCWLPPEIEGNFGKVLMHLGWQKPPWPCFSRKVE